MLLKLILIVWIFYALAFHIYPPIHRGPALGLWLRSGKSPPENTRSLVVKHIQIFHLFPLLRVHCANNKKVTNKTRVVMGNSNRNNICGMYGIPDNRFNQHKHYKQ